MRKLIGKIYLKTDNQVSFDVIEFKGIKYVVIEHTPIDLDFFNMKYFDYYEDIKWKEVMKLILMKLINILKDKKRKAENRLQTQLILKGLHERGF